MKEEIKMNEKTKHGNSFIKPQKKERAFIGQILMFMVLNTKQDSLQSKTIGGHSQGNLLSNSQRPWRENHCACKNIFFSPSILCISCSTKQPHKDRRTRLRLQDNFHYGWFSWGTRHRLKILKVPCASLRGIGIYIIPLKTWIGSKCLSESKTIPLIHFYQPSLSFLEGDLRSPS